MSGSAAPTLAATRLEGPGTYDLLPDDQIDGEWPNPADVIGVPLVDVTFDYVATSAGDLPRVVFWKLDSSADMARQMIDNLKLAGYIPQLRGKLDQRQEEGGTI